MKSGRNVLNDQAGLALTQMTASLDMIEQWAALHLLEHDKELLLLLEELNDLENVGAVAAMQIDLDLLEHALSIRMSVLVNDLHGVFVSRVNILAGPYFAVRSLSQHLSRQRIDVRETIGLHVGGKASLLLLVDHRWHSHGSS